MSMNDFEIIRSCKNEEVLKQKFYKQRFKDLGQVPFHSGIFILTFPNEKFYMGATNNLRFRLREIFIELFPKPQTLLSRQRNGRRLYQKVWMEKARKENPSIKTYKDLKIKCIVCENPKE